MRYLLAVLLLMVPTAKAAVELNEKTTKAQFQECCSGYQDARDAAVAALDVPDYLEAVKQYQLAADLTPFKIVRARHLANAAWALLLQAEADLGEIGEGGAGKGAAKGHLQEAEKLIGNADAMAEGLEDSHGIKAAGFAKDRKDIRGAIESRLKGL